MATTSQEPVGLPVTGQPIGPPVTGQPVGLPVAGQPAERADAAANRDRILCAARRVLAEHGAAGLSMNSVAAAAGVGKGTIFRRFGDREGLLFALLHEHTAELQDAFLSGPPPLGPGAPAPARLEAFIAALVRHQDRHLELLLAADMYAGDGAPPAYATYLVHVATLVAEIDPALDGAAVAGLILGAVSPRVQFRLRHDAGAEVDAVQDAAVALLRGLTGPR